MQPTNRQKLLMYVGHLRHALGDGEGAVAALDAAFGAAPTNPTPLLLAANWRLDAGDPDAARRLYERALAVGAPGRLDLKAHSPGLRRGSRARCRRHLRKAPAILVPN